MAQEENAICESISAKVFVAGPRPVDRNPLRRSAALIVEILGPFSVSAQPDVYLRRYLETLSDNGQIRLGVPSIYHNRDGLLHSIVARRDETIVGIDRTGTSMAIRFPGRPTRFSPITGTPATSPSRAAFLRCTGQARTRTYPSSYFKGQALLGLDPNYLSLFRK